MVKSLAFACIFLLFSLSGYSQTKHTLSGYIKDAANGEALIGSALYIKELNTGVSANTYGFYSITLPDGNYTLIYTFVGYEKSQQQISLTQDQKIDVELKEESVELKEVTVSGNKEEDPLVRIHSTQMSTQELSIKTIKKMPMFLGEVDVIRSIQSLPGISTVGEGASGYNSRGGSVGQNLILLDDAPVYNSSHLLGFFSIFNPDAVTDVKLYKGGIPSNYGGRLSSILDVRMKEGNMKKYEVTGGVGTIFSRLAFEGPIVKDKGSFIIAARRSYIDILARPFVKALQDGAALNFYDLTAKVNYKFTEKDRVYLSGYFGRDNFLFGKGQGFSWGNQTGTIRWNHLYNQKLFSNVTAVYSEYLYKLQFGQDNLNSFKWNSSINNFIFKPTFTYFINNNNEFSFGGEAIYYFFNPASVSSTTNGATTNINLEKKYNLEASLYASNIQRIGRVSLEYGIRFSQFTALGTDTVYHYNDTTAGIRRTPKSYTAYGKGQIVKQFNNWQPRLSAKFQVNEVSSIKASYNRMVQYLHLISNTTASNPLDVWTPTSPNILPEVGDQYALGYFRTLGQNHQWEASVETYLRNTQNQIDYINGASLLVNKYLEGDLLMGKGRAYGLEFYLQRKTGRLNGWISYTLAKTEMQVDGINNNQWYYARYDQRHNAKLALFYDLNKRVSFSANFVFMSGTPTTFPTSRYIENGILIPYNADNSRNNVRMKSYNRLDLSVRWDGKTERHGVKRKNHDYWVVSLYNVYARQNPFAITFTQNDQRVAPGQAIQSQAQQISIIGSIVPSLSYNFNF